MNQSKAWQISWKLTAVFALGCRFAQAHTGLDAGPMFDRFALTLREGERMELLGPLFYHQATEDSTTIGLPPIFSLDASRELSRLEYDLAYPLLTYDRTGSEYRWQLIQLFSFSGGGDQDGSSRDRFTLFPIYFQQWSDNDHKNYWALFPFYGHIEGRLFRKSIDFVLWPLYAKTTRGPGVITNQTILPEKAREFFSAPPGEIATYNFLYPLFHVRYGDGLHGWQFWPLTGHESKVVTTRTNSWGEIESIPGHEKRFVLWPIFSDEVRGIGSTNQAHFQALLPFYTSLRSQQRDSTSYFWPLGVTVTDDREQEYHEVDAPWPIVVFAHGKGKTTRRVWPFFGRARSESLESDFYLWPVYKFNRLQAGALDRKRTRILFFLYSNVEEHNTETGSIQLRRDLLPFFTYKRDRNGSSRLQILALLEPILPGNKSIERNYSPVWSLWRMENNPTTGARSQSLLWNLYRCESTPSSKKFSLLFGLFRYQSDAEGRRLRVLYLPFGSNDSGSHNADSDP